MKKLMAGLLVIVAAALCLSYAYFYYGQHSASKKPAKIEKINKTCYNNTIRRNIWTMEVEG